MRHGRREREEAEGEEKAAFRSVFWGWVRDWRRTREMEKGVCGFIKDMLGSQYNMKPKCTALHERKDLTVINCHRV